MEGNSVSFDVTAVPEKEPSLKQPLSRNAVRRTNDIENKCNAYNSENEAKS